MLISVSYSEIMLKGDNRGQFEGRLEENMIAALREVGAFRCRRLQGRILLSSESTDAEAAKAVLTRTFGIDYVSFPMEAKADIGDIGRVVLSLSHGLIGKKIRVDTKRADKRFPLTSPQVNGIIGKALVDAGCSVDLDNPDTTVSIEILNDRALIYTERFPGPCGLPLGSSGRLLSLLSGGIDSPVSSWMMMKRGCELDFLHLHQSQQNRDVMETKMARLIRALGAYSPRKLRLIAAPYSEFYKRTMDADPKIELVLFRRFLFHLSNALSEQHGYLGAVTGDSVGQVASQTVGNIFASDEASKIPVYRPLAGFNKQEIIDLSRKIGTYELSIEPYKDCCSLVAHKNPSTKVPLQAAKKAEEGLGMGGIVERTLAAAEIFEV